MGYCTIYVLNKKTSNIHDKYSSNVILIYVVSADVTFIPKSYCIF